MSFGIYNNITLKCQGDFSLQIPSGHNYCARGHRTPHCDCYHIMNYCVNYSITRHVKEECFCLLDSIYLRNFPISGIFTLDFTYPPPMSPPFIIIYRIRCKINTVHSISSICGNFASQQLLLFNLAQINS